ncbi:MAG: ABC transporter permease [Candidatus Omnitrophica bacterium]|nr:ABC transporter permease [Candidatus Omnitrophota bacterium]
MNFRFINEMYKYQQLIICLALKEIKIRYKSALLGWFWSVLNPLLLMSIFYFIFTFIFRMDIEKFPLFLLCALLPWFFFSFSIGNATTAIVDNASLIKKTYFPYEVIPLSIVLANLLNFLISLVLLFGFLICFNVYPAGSWIWLPVIVVLQSIFVLGACLGFSALHAVFRDVRYGVDLLMLVWFYATPIFYPLSYVPENFRGLFYFNPLSVFISLYRDILLYQKYPDTALICAAFLASGVSYMLGIFVFMRYKKVFADVT